MTGAGGPGAGEAGPGRSEGALAGDGRGEEGTGGGERVGGFADRVLPLFDHTHGPGTTAIVVAFAAVLGLLAGWLVADFGVRTLGFLVGAVGTGYLLYGQPTRRAVLSAGCYSLAALVAAVPVVYELGLVVAVDDPLRHLLSAADLLLFVVFWLLAAVPALVGYRIESGPFLGRLLR